MNQSLNINLFTTLGCHLCEDAKAMLIYFQEQSGVSFHIISVEITESQKLLENYGVRIPVLQHSQSGEELDWPFNMEQLALFLQV